MDYIKLFYWLTVVDGLKGLLLAIAIFFGILLALVVIMNVINFIEEEDDKTVKRWSKQLWWLIPIFSIAILLQVFIPSKKNALLIIGGGTALNYVTNDSTCKQIPKELSTFVVTELKSMAADAKTSLGVADQQNKILDEAKNMSSKELIEKMKNDTSFAKILLK